METFNSQTKNVMILSFKHIRNLTSNRKPLPVESGAKNVGHKNSNLYKQTGYHTKNPPVFWTGNFHDVDSWDG